MELKNVEGAQVDVLVTALGSILKAIVRIAQCVDEIKCMKTIDNPQVSGILESN